MTATTRCDECTSTPASAPTLLMAMELGRFEWKLGFTIGLGQRPRRRTIRTDRWEEQLGEELAAAKRRFRLPADAPVISCYEAGPDGFWVHRYLMTLGVQNLVVDSASIEVNRRRRRAKTDRLDVEKLLAQLVRYVGGERKALRVVHVPTEADEHRRQLHRELRALITDRRRVMNRIGGLLATQGVRTKVLMDFASRLPRLRMWNGEPLPVALYSRLEREWAKVELFSTHISALERARNAALRHATDPTVVMVRRLLELRGMGERSAWLFVMELFAWRQFTNRRQVGAVTGLVPTPYQSGTLDREQGISKAGNRTVRAIAVQIAWIWVRYQPQSALTQWYLARFARGGPRARKVGIVAVARRLVIDLWRYLDAGVIPEGAIFRPKGAPRGATPCAA
jgi:transposase